MPQSVSKLFVQFNKYFPVIITMMGLALGNFIYKVKDEFKDEILDQMEIDFASKGSMKEYVKQQKFITFKQEVAMSITNLNAEIVLQKAIVAGNLKRLQGDVSEIKADLKALIKSGQKE